MLLLFICQWILLVTFGNFLSSTRHTDTDRQRAWGQAVPYATLSMTNIGVAARSRDDCPEIDSCNSTSYTFISAVSRRSYGSQQLIHLAADSKTELFPLIADWFRQLHVVTSRVQVYHFVVNSHSQVTDKKNCAWLSCRCRLMTSTYCKLQLLQTVETEQSSRSILVEEYHSKHQPYVFLFRSNNTEMEQFSSSVN